MCGRFTVAAAEVAKVLVVASLLELTPRFNVFPSQQVLVGRPNEAGERIVNQLLLNTYPARKVGRCAGVHFGSVQSVAANPFRKSWINPLPAGNSIQTTSSRAAEDHTI